MTSQFDAEYLAKLQLQYYNARDSVEFLKLFAETDFEMFALRSTCDGFDPVFDSAAPFQTRYKTVFANSPDLKAFVSSRTVFRSESSGRSWAIDSEQFTGLRKPIGSSLDGSTGLSEPLVGHILVMYQGNSSGQIDRVWFASVTEDLFKDPARQNEDPRFRYLVQVACDADGKTMIPHQTLF